MLNAVLKPALLLAAASYQSAVEIHHSSSHAQDATNVTLKTATLLSGSVLHTIQASIYNTIGRKVVRSL